MKWIAIDQESGTELLMEDGETQVLSVGHLLAEDGTLQRDTGTGSLWYDGQVDTSDEEFQLFDFDGYGFEATVEWDGSNHVLVETRGGS